jgi:hypothetical protein
MATKINGLFRDQQTWPSFQQRGSPVRPKCRAVVSNRPLVDRLLVATRIIINSGELHRGAPRGQAGAYIARAPHNG